MKDFEERRGKGWTYYCLPDLEAEGITHAFFTKASPSYASGEEGREEFLTHFSLRDAVSMRQEHSDIFHVIRDDERPSAGDGLILLGKGIAGVIRTADCLPVILADPGFPMAAIIHAGWRGTAKGIVAGVVREMVRLGARLERITALLGPSIGSCCYEVKEDVRAIFSEKGFPEEVFHSKGGALYLDIRGANRWLLEAAGIERMADLRLCTSCSPHLFASFRRGGKETRQVNFVSLSDKVY